MNLNPGSPPPLVVWGASGHAHVVADIVRLAGTFRIVGFLDDLDGARRGADFCGAPVLGGREQLEHLHAEGVRHLFLGFGDCRARLQLAPLAERHGFELPTLIHPRAVVGGDVTLGRGTVLMAGAVVNPGSAIQDHVILNTSCSVDHDCRVGDGAHVGPGARIGGLVTIGAGTWIGIGATIRDRVRIGSGSIVGAGALVLHDVPDGVVAFGTPARVVRPVT
jgi:UDP-N-acetylbacillosamine N-acetyltransferase